ncbi:UDP-glycosyltransferase UGT5 isoform X1 [Drosophila santomea]|uniref:UDP-glycosyltransferase UGT5 isoform X1 n=1 Tax=Drosophila santomea TaxID=129105 RepID=UPI00195499F8|nr:UDP-glycosyltransferase UGT5 isoform X1 [Drosophila santomea]
MWPILLLLCLHPGYLEGARILAVFPLPSPSHYFFALPYLKSLASLGHEITSVSPYPQREPFKNIHDIPVPEVFENFNEILKIASTPRSTWQSSDFINEYVLNLTRTVLNNEGVRRSILGPQKPHFDLVVMDVWRFDVLMGLAAYFDAPIIGLGSYGTDYKIDELMGNISPMSYLQSPSSRFYDLEAYGQRLSYLVERTVMYINYKWRHVRKQEALYKEYFPSIAEGKPLSKISRNFSLVLLNQHFTLGPPRPYVPNMIEVGGLHVNPKPEALPAELDNFIQGAGESGVIYFSLGTNVKSKSLSEDRRKVLLETFASLPQRVLWKFEDEQLPGKPSNVFISKWFSQQSILAHPSVKLFITHGGLLSTIESIHHGKPMLGLPCFFDQFRNMAHVKQMGLGLVLNIKEMTSEDFNSTIRRLLTNKSFEETARITAARHRDQPMKPLDTAIWWTEYVLRHKGAAHMQVAGKDLDFVRYHSLDVFGTFLIGALGLLGVFTFFIYVILRKCLLQKKDTNEAIKKIQ